MIIIINDCRNEILLFMEQGRPSRRTTTALLLAQVGAHGAKRFAERLAAIKLAPPHAGILRRLAQNPGASQRVLAARLGMHASRLVGIVDEMESMGLVVRQGNAKDRRTYSLQLTPKGTEMLAAAGAISMEHDRALCAALNDEERVILTGLLQRIADDQGLLPGVHPGFRTLGGRPPDSGEAGKKAPAKGGSTKA
jgi:DNA-binding MarR family transcriptional regulator